MTKGRPCLGLSATRCSTVAPFSTVTSPDVGKEHASQGAPPQVERDWVKAHVGDVEHGAP